MSRVRLSFRRTPPLTNHESSVGAGRALSANLRVGEHRLHPSRRRDARCPALTSTLTSVTDDERPLSALPSPAARVAAFAAILIGGLAGGLIGYTLVKLQCDGECAAPRGIGALTGALLAAGGMGVVAVLVLRAVGEWRQIEQRESSGRS